MMKFKRIETGHYATEDGKFEIVKDVTGYVSDEERDGIGVNAGCDDDGWAAVENDQTLDWFDTKREAKEYLERKES